MKARVLRRGPAKQPGISVHDLGLEQYGIVTFLKEGEAPGKTRDRLFAMNMNVHVSRSLGARELDLPAPRFGRARRHQRANLERRVRG